MNKITALLCTVMYVCVPMCAQEYSGHHLYQAEASCNLAMYIQILTNAQFSQERMNDSLFNVIDRCSTSGILSKLIQHNLAHGGQTTATQPNIAGFHETPLLQLTKRVKEENQDVAAAIQILVNNRDPSLHKSLGWAARLTNIAALKMLLSAGADPLQRVYLWNQNDGHTTALEQSEEQLKEKQHDKELHKFRLANYCKHAAYCKSKWGIMYRAAIVLPLDSVLIHEDHPVSWWHDACESHKEDDLIIDQPILAAETICALLKACVATS